MSIESRVVEVYARTPSQGIIGSGYLIADQLVLTARHVIRGASSIEVRPLRTTEWLPAHSVWSGDGEVDATLLRVDQPCRLKPGQLPVRWGSIVGAQDLISCSAVGFPSSQVRQSDMRDVRDTEHLVGHVAPLTQVKARRYAISAITSLPKEQLEGHSAWEGMSGAALFTGPYLIGLIVIDPHAFEADRLVALPADTFVRNEGFVRLVAHDAEIPVVPIGPRLRLYVGPNLSFLLQPPYRPPPMGFQLVAAPGVLLLAVHGIVPFLGREQQLRELEQWCEAGGPLALRQLTGQGGTGKSRLAAELCVRLRGRGWETGFADIVSSGGDTRLELERPTLIVIDDAEVNVRLVDQVVGHLAHRPPGVPKVRVLLIARHRGAWFDQLRQQQPLVDGYGIQTNPMALDSVALRPTDRVKQFNAASRAFAPHLGTTPVTTTLESMSDPAFERPLLTHMSALITTAGGGVPTSAPGGVRAEVVGWILRREKQRWDETRQIHLLMDLDPQVAHQAVATATLAGAETEVEAVELLSVIGDLADRERRGKVARWLHQLYSGGLYVNPLGPDLLTEQMLTETPHLNELVLAIHGRITGLPQVARLVNVLSVAAEHRPEVRKVLENLVQGRLEALVKAAVEAPDGPLPEALNRALDLCHGADGTGDPVLVSTVESVLERIPDRSAGLARLAATIATLAVDHMRLLVVRDPVCYQPRLGAMLTGLGARLWDIQRREGALAACHESVAVLGPLSRMERQHLPRFGKALTRLGLTLTWAKQWRDAQHVTGQAVDLYRELVTTDPSYERALAGVLLNQGVILEELHDRRAIDVTKEALRIFRRRARSNPEERVAYVATLGNLGIRLHHFKKHRKDLATLQRAVALSRQFATEDAEKYLLWLGSSLQNLSQIQVDHGDFERAIQAQYESVESFRKATSINADVHWEPLVKGLANLGGLLFELGKVDGALGPIEEAVAICRRLAETNPEKFMSGLPTGLRNLAAIRRLLGDIDGARRAVKEATEIEAAIPRPERRHASDVPPRMH
jgi:tetratricopeptide (TPR) repeat protein